MAITKSQKIPRGYEVQPTRLRELGDGVSPSIQVFPAYYLPLVKEDKVHELWKVIEAGQIVAIDATSLHASVNNENWLVPANGAVATTLTYTTDDVAESTPDIDVLQSSGAYTAAAAGAASTTVAANLPAGFAVYDYYSKAVELVYHNTFPQPQVNFVTDYLFEIPLIFHAGDGAVGTTARSSANPGDRQDSIAAGGLIQAGISGWPTRWTSASSVEQIVGRCVQVLTIGVKDALDKVHTVPGLSLPGTGTSGKQLHETYSLLGTSTDVVHKVRINITLA